MKVKELMNVLSKFEPDLEVIIATEKQISGIIKVSQIVDIIEDTIVYGNTSTEALKIASKIVDGLPRDGFDTVINMPKFTPNNKIGSQEPVVIINMSKVCNSFVNSDEK